MSIQIEYKGLEEQVDRYLYESNVVALMDTLSYILSHFKIYFNVKYRDVILVYRDYMSTGLLLTIVLRTGVAVKVKVDMDKNREKIIGAEVWYHNE